MLKEHVLRLGIPESLVCPAALVDTSHAKQTYILGDRTKYHLLGSIPFAKLSDAILITDSIGNFDPSLVRYMTISGDSNL